MSELDRKSEDRFSHEAAQMLRDCLSGDNLDDDQPANSRSLIRVFMVRTIRLVSSRPGYNAVN